MYNTVDFIVYSLNLSSITFQYSLDKLVDLIDIEYQLHCFIIRVQILASLFDLFIERFDFFGFGLSTDLYLFDYLSILSILFQQLIILLLDVLTDVVSNVVIHRFSF